MASTVVPINDNRISAALDGRYRFSSLGEQLQAIRNATVSGGSDLDPRLTAIQRRAAVIPAGASEKIPSDGGFLVAPELSKQLFLRLYNTGKIIKQCTLFPMSRNVFSIPEFAETSRVTGSRFGGVQVYHEDEAQALNVITPGFFTQKPTFALPTLTAKKYTGFTACTDELDTDTSAYSTWASIAYTSELKFQLEQDIVSGTGAGQAQGVVNAPGTIVIPKSIGHAVGTVNGSDVQSMMTALWAASKPKAIWLYNPDLLNSLISLTVAIGTAGSELSLWHFGDGKPDSLCGCLAFASEYCSAPGTPGDILLADFSRYALGMRRANTGTANEGQDADDFTINSFIRGEMSIHIEFLTDQNVFRWILRADGQLMDIAPIVSANSSQPTSPVVVLAAR